MIALRCSNCGKMQELEDPFAGCVCRCRFCRAIQTVPDQAPPPAAGEGAPMRCCGDPILLHCPELVRPAASAPARPMAQSTDRRLILAVGLAAVLALGAAGGAIALLRSLETPEGGETSISGPAELVDSRLDR